MLAVGPGELGAALAGINTEGHEVGGQSWPEQRLELKGKFSNRGEKSR